MNCLTNMSYRAIKDVMRRLQSSSSTASSFDIKIPNRIERGPTDILKALARTISKDPTAPHYNYIDDPYLVPKTKLDQRLRALSYESGRKTAMWITQEHGDLFPTPVADPVIPEFSRRIPYTSKDQVSEEILLDTISNGQTLEALKIYDLLEENVSTKAKQSLLELLCFSNSDDLPQSTFQMEQWFKITEPITKCVWKETEQIKNLSDFLTSQDQETAAAAYNALICGMAKFYQVKKAWALYLKCKQDNIKLNIHAYNAIIKIVPRLKGSLQKPSRDVFNLLKEMSMSGIYPNIRTLNAALETVYTFDSYEKVLEYIHRVLGEFKTLGVTPSLASYRHILAAANEGDSVISILHDILDVLEKDTLTICHPDDVTFFNVAMEIARRECNLELGERLFALYLKDDNYKFISTSASENIFYRQYVLLNLSMQPIDVFFKLYDNLTMNIYIPESFIFEKICESLKLHSNEIILQYLPKLWSQMKMLNIFDIDKVIKVALELTSKCDIESESPLHETFAKYAVDYWNHKQSKISSIRQVLWDASVLGNMILLCLRASWYDQALEITSFLVHEEASQMGQLDVAQVKKLSEICILHGYGPIALLLVKYAVKFNLEDAAIMAREVYNVIPLDASEKEELINLVGNDVLQLQLFDDR